MRFLRVLPVLFILLLAGIRPSLADEGEERYGGISVAPTQSTTAVEMIFQTVDADIFQEGERTWASVDCVFKLHNTDRLEEVKMMVGFPSWDGEGLHFDPKRLLGFRVTIDGQTVALERSRVQTKIDDGLRELEWYVWELILAPDERKVIEASFRADLGEGLLAHFPFALMGEGWKGPVGSARITVHMPQRTIPQQFVGKNPNEVTFDGQSITWDFTEFTSSERLSITFVKPSLWQSILTAREEVARNPSSAEAHHTLAGLYKRLSMAASPDEAGYPVFYARAVGELETAKRLEPTLLAPYLDLAALYQMKANSQNGRMRGEYMRLAVEEMERVLEIAPDRVETEKRLGGAYLYLAASYQAQGLFPEAAAYLDKAAHLPSEGASIGREDLDKRRQEIYRSWALALLEEGKVEKAFWLMETHLAGHPLTLHEDIRPRFASFSGEIHTTPTKREISFVFRPFGVASPQLLEEMQKLAQRLEGTADAQVALELSEKGYELKIEVPFRSAEELTDKMSRLSTTLPRIDEELAPLAAIFDSQGLELAHRRGLLREGLSFKETVDLSPANRSLEAKAEEIERIMNRLKVRPPSELDTAHRLELGVLEEYRKAWLKLLADSKLIYEVKLTPTDHVPLSRTWMMRLEDRRTLELTAVSYHTTNLALIGAGCLLLLVILPLLAWRMTPGPRRRA